MESLPVKTARVLGKRWKLKLVKPEEKAAHGMGERDSGMTWDEKREIYVDSSFHGDEIREVVLHELMHAVELSLRTGFPENAIRQLSVGLFATMRDNPKLCDFIFNEQPED